MHKILVIEDEDHIREIIQDVLSLENFHTLTAENGRIGLELASDYQPDLILCDIMMPELDGYGVLQALRQNETTASIPLIFLTARTSRSDQRRGMELGADDYLTKPFMPNELLSAIATQLKKKATVEQQAQNRLEELCNSIALALPHELHTPLNGIISISDLLIQDLSQMDEAEVMELLKTIHGSAKRLYRLTQNFLLYSDLELIASTPQRMEVHRRTSTSSNSKATIAHITQQKAKQFNRDADLHMDLEDAIVRMSDVKLTKILDELLDNAFKFSDRHTPVQVVTKLHGDDFLTLYIVDRGRGMTADQISRLGAYMQFERNLYEQQGSGLGLVIAKRLAEIHGGGLTIESVPNQKTTVCVTLRLQDANTML